MPSAVFDAALRALLVIETMLALPGFVWMRWLEVAA